MALEPITRQEKIIAGQDLTPITRMEKFLKQYGGGSGGVTSWNDLTDKPFGEVTTVKEVLAECQPEFVEGEGVFVLMGESDIAVGEKYTVNWNGADYECVAVSAPNNSIALGNMSAMGGDNTGEPFLIAYNIDASAWSFIDMTGSTTLTISIRQEVTTVQKMSGKYVEGMGYVEKSVKETFPVQEITFDDEGGCSLEADFEKPEIGQECIVTLDGVEYTCVAWDCVVAAAVGNGALAGFETETDYPFFLEFSRCVIVAPEFAGKTVSFGIKIVSETIHPIDPKFLPSGGGAVIFTMTDTGYTCNVTYAEADEMLRNGASAFVQMFRNTLEAAMGGQRLTADTIQWHTDDAGAYMMINFGTTLGLVYKEDNTITEAT